MRETLGAGRRSWAGLVLSLAGLGVLAGAVAAPASAVAGTAEEFEAGLWWHRSLNLDEVHQSVTGEGVQIALLDGPVSTDVPELQGQDVRPTSSLCNDAARSGAPSTPEQPLSELTAHTTSMTAVLVGNGQGNGPGGRGVPGVAPGATVRTYSFFDSYRNVEDKDLGHGCEHRERVTHGELIREAVADGADIVVQPNNHFGPGAEEAISRAIAEEDVIFVASAGNGGPGARPDQITSVPGTVNTVAIGENGSYWDGNSSAIAPLFYLDEAGQLTEDLEKAVGLSPEMSSQGRPIIAASGVEMTSGNVIEGRWVSAARNSGTSGAAVTVAGALALAMERWPEATGDQILQSLVRHANRPEGVSYDLYYGYGGLSLSKLLEVDPTQYPDVHPFYGGLRWAFHEDPPEPFFGEPTEDGVFLWYPTYADAELDLPHPQGPLEPEVYGSVGTTADTRGDDVVGDAPSPAPEGAEGVQVWVWGVGGALVIAGGAAALARRRANPGDGGGASQPETADVAEGAAR